MPWMVLPHNSANNKTRPPASMVSSTSGSVDDNPNDDPGLPGVWGGSWSQGEEDEEEEYPRMGGWFWGKRTTQAEHMLQAGSDEGDVDKVVAALVQVHIQYADWRWPQSHYPPPLLAAPHCNLWCKSSSGLVMLGQPCAPPLPHYCLASACPHKPVRSWVTVSNEPYVSLSSPSRRAPPR
jgi:hypothetical protein